MTRRTQSKQRRPKTRGWWFTTVALWLLMPVNMAAADGGAVAWTGTRLEQPAAVVVSPPSPRVGAIEIAWIGARDAAAEVILRHEDGTVMRSAFESARIDGEFKADFEVERPGTWLVEIDPDGEGAAEPVRFNVVVGGPIPPWRSLWMPLFAWVPLVLIGLAAAWRRAG